MPHPTGDFNRYFESRPKPIIVTRTNNAFALLDESRTDSSSSTSSPVQPSPVAEKTPVAPAIDQRRPAAEKPLNLNKPFRKGNNQGYNRIPTAESSVLTVQGLNQVRSTLPDHTAKAQPGPSQDVSSSDKYGQASGGPKVGQASINMRRAAQPSAQRSPSSHTTRHVPHPPHQPQVVYRNSPSNDSSTVYTKSSYQKNHHKGNARDRHGFTKVSAYNEKEELRREGSEQKQLVKLVYTGEPPPGFVFKCVRDIVYDPVIADGAKKKTYAVDEIFGYNLAALNQIRARCHVFIVMISGNGQLILRFLAQTPDHLENALAQYQTKLRQARASVKSRLPQVIWSGWGTPAVKTVILKPRPDLYEHQRKVVLAPNAVPTSSHSGPDQQGYHIGSVEMRKLKDAIDSSLDDARVFHGVLQLRVQLGTIILEQTPKDITGNRLPIDEFEDLCDDLDYDGITFCPRLPEDLDRKFPGNLFRAERFIVPKDAFTTDLRLASCTYHGSYFFEVGDYTYCLEVNFSGDISSPVRGRDQWVRLKRKDKINSGVPRSFSLMDVTLSSPNEYGMCWNFGLSVTQKLRSKDVPERLLDFAKHVQMDIHTDKGLDPSANRASKSFLIHPPGHPNLQYVQLSRKYEYRIRGSSYCVEASRVLDIPCAGSRSSQQPLTEFKTIAVKHDGWDSLVLRNEKDCDATEGALFGRHGPGSALNDFFPDETHDNPHGGGSGLEYFLDKLADIESVISERYWTRLTDPVPQIGKRISLQPVN